MSTNISRRRFLVAGASVLAVGAAALVGGTFARYTTQGTSDDSARVAKFGVTVSVDSTATFASEYKKSDTVIVKADQDIVAPATSGVLADATVSGTTEVAVRVAYELKFNPDDTAQYWDKWKVDDETYFPIIFTVGENTYRMKGGTETASTTGTEKLYENLEGEDGLLKAVEAAVAAWTTEYDPGVTLTSQVTDQVLKWEWPLGATDGAYQTSAKDTKLGTAAASDAPQIKIKLTVTVSQIDSFDATYKRVSASN